MPLEYSKIFMPMNKFSQSEIDFARKCLSNNIRLDERQCNQQREETIEKCNISQADASICLKRGNSEIILNFSFKASIETLKTLDLIPHLHISNSYLSCSLYTNNALNIFASSETFKDFSTLKCTFNEPNPCFNKIEEWLNSYNLGLQIELVIVTADGNIFDMFFNGLKYILESVNVPNIKNLSSDIPSFLSIPTSTSFACLNNTFFRDPTLIEEQSSDGIIHLYFESDKKISIYCEGLKDIHVIQSIISSFEKNYAELKNNDELTTF